MRHPVPASQANFHLFRDIATTRRKSAYGRTTVTKEGTLFFNTLSLILKPLTPPSRARTPLPPHICLLLLNQEGNCAPPSFNGFLATSSLCNVRQLAAKGPKPFKIERFTICKPLILKQPVLENRSNLNPFVAPGAAALRKMSPAAVRRSS
ncbi:hypothetical protein SBA4_4670003 [Candidatus Sulfopaludibacter sp. SbA4]|nr:hypothetical protein SBA4_4670003 [Candidatus Sulfopaludibacter sp. SbA4]